MKSSSRPTFTTTEPFQTSTTRAETTLKPILTTAYTISIITTTATTKQAVSFTEVINSTSSSTIPKLMPTVKSTISTSKTTLITSQPIKNFTTTPTTVKPTKTTTYPVLSSTTNKLSTLAPTKSSTTTFLQTPQISSSSTFGPEVTTTFRNTNSTSTILDNTTPSNEIQKTDFVSIRAMEIDHYCDAFDCVVDIEPVDTCFTYSKEIPDIDCHLFCKLDNCTKQPSTEIYCPTYICIPKPSPGPGPTPPPPPGPSPIPPMPVSDNLAIIITILVGITIFLGLCFFIGIFVYRRRNASNAQNIEEGNAERDPFVVANPSMSSSEDLENDDFETTPAAAAAARASASAIMAQVVTSIDPTLEDDVQAIIDKHKCAGSVASTTTNLSDELESVQNTFKMCNLKKRNVQIPNSNMIETSVC